MKKTLLFLAALPLFNIKAQTIDSLDFNNIKAFVNTGGLLFKRPGGPGFEAPKGSGAHSIYAANMWIGGKDPLDTTYIAATNFGVTQDFQPGPVMDSLSYAPRYAYWNRLWKVSKNDIIDHILNYTSVGYVMPASIADWPGNGDALYGEPAVVAPYVDVNLNGTYDPLNGDYPEILGRQAIYQVFNDDKVHDATGGPKMKVEIHCMVYEFESCGDSALNNTVFVNYRVINRGLKTFHNTGFGFFTDIDLGYYSDDYMSSDVSRGMFYAFNGDPIDATTAWTTGYGVNLPMQGVTFLGGGYMDTDGSDNPFVLDYPSMLSTGGIVYEGQGVHYADGTIDNERGGMNKYISYTGLGAPTLGMSDPDNDAQYYNYLNGKWRDGSQLMFGGNGYPGHPGVSTTPTDFAYFYDTDPNYVSTLNTIVTPDWREDIAGNTPGDRRGMGASGYFTMNPGETNEFDVALTFARDLTIDSLPLGSLPLLETMVDTLRNYFEADSTPCGKFKYHTAIGIDEIEDQIIFSVYPNPAHDYITIMLEDQGNTTSYELYDILGNVIIEKKRMNNVATIDISNIANGIYFIDISNEKQHTAKKIIVTHK